jgi:TrwC relaxase
MHGCRLVAAEGLGRVALPVKALKAGQEAYWLDQIARNREEYFSGRGESPGRFVGSAAQASGLEEVASAEQVRAMFRGLDPATGEQRCAPLWRADPRSKLAAGPLLEALNAHADQHGVEDLEALAASKALQGDVRSIQAACRLGGARRVKVETVERLCRKVLGIDPYALYGEGFDQAWQHRGKRVNERVQAFDHCFSSPKSVSLLAAGASPQVRRLWPRAAPRRSRSRSATWNATASGSAGSTTAPTATRRSGGWWRWRSSTA